MIHIDYMSLPDAAKKLAGGERRGVVCDALFGEDDTLTDTALASDCDNCRLRINIGGIKDKGGDGRIVGVKPVPVFKPGECLGPGKVEG